MALVIISGCHWWYSTGAPGAVPQWLSIHNVLGNVPILQIMATKSSERFWTLRPVRARFPWTHHAWNSIILKWGNCRKIYLCMRKRRFKVGDCGFAQFRAI